jgi:hypothetical protein
LLIIFENLSSNYRSFSQELNHLAAESCHYSLWLPEETGSDQVLGISELLQPEKITIENPSGFGVPPISSIMKIPSKFCGKLSSLLPKNTLRWLDITQNSLSR